MIFFRVFRHFKVSGSGYLLVSPHLIDAFQIKGRGGEKKSLSFAFAVTLFWIIVFNIGGTHRGIHLQLGYTNKCLLQNITFSAISDFVAFAVCVPLYWVWGRVWLCVMHRLIIFSVRRGTLIYLHSLRRHMKWLLAFIIPCLDNHFSRRWQQGIGDVNNFVNSLPLCAARHHWLK